MSMQTVFLICGVNAYQDIFLSFLKAITKKKKRLYIMWLLCEFCTEEHKTRNLLGAFPVSCTTFLLLDWFLLNIYLIFFSGSSQIDKCLSVLSYLSFLTFNLISLFPDCLNFFPISWCISLSFSSLCKLVLINFVTRLTCSVSVSFA